MYFRNSLLFSTLLQYQKNDITIKSLLTQKSRMLNSPKHRICTLWTDGSNCCSLKNRSKGARISTNLVKTQKLLPCMLQNKHFYRLQHGTWLVFHNQWHMNISYRVTTAAKETVYVLNVGPVPASHMIDFLRATLRRRFQVQEFPQSYWSSGVGGG